MSRFNSQAHKLLDKQGLFRQIDLSFQIKH